MNPNVTNKPTKNNIDCGQCLNDYKKVAGVPEDGIYTDYPTLFSMSCS